MALRTLKDDGFAFAHGNASQMTSSQAGYPDATSQGRR